ncbi:S8 family serine peptidase [Candidatus Halocynthiibacter alkanivorans]|uniref:S8 family serine peptidase n=1 Tax=Candidatus Halocynthiibacter alkanivorans TaxID=2267619 RepID=UPI000DF38DF7|nr:S8 family serine peptidase [Candidatus Halocynthiibacter alkanivorans]
MQPTDPRYSSQWQFTLLGDIETLWDEYSGEGVAVAVYDTGIDYSHPDLDDNYDASQQYNRRFADDGLPDSGSDPHGTAVAGIIAAENNGSGIIGVAWGSSLTSVDYLNLVQYKPASDYADAMRYMSNFDVVNNSWGSFGNYSASVDVTRAGSRSQADHIALQYAVQTGRGGLGTVVTKAAGNDANDSALLRSDGIIGNAQGEGLNTVREIITVAATDSSGEAKSYSNWGSNILLTAPAASFTTDMTGASGYASGSYTSGFGGTSAATPVVTGVAALMLDTNPQLGWRDVQNILATSAAHTGSAYGDTARGYEVEAWFVNDAANWNGGGMSFNSSYGFGMVDAFAAVRMAEVWGVITPGAATSSNQLTVSANSGGASKAIPSTGIADLMINMSANIEIEHIYVSVELSHARISDLRLELISPDGQTFVLRDKEGLGAYDGSWTFGITAALGQKSQGSWTLRATDMLSGKSGTLQAASIEFLGKSVSADTVYSYTDDFLTMRGVDAARATLSDTDGGSDWINMAAIAGDITADLNPAGRITVSGQDWFTLSADRSQPIENIVTGDGDDVLAGNAADNYLMGMRGDDWLSGQGGADTLNGGAGFDTADYASADAAVTADLLLAARNLGAAEGDIFIAIEGLRGSAYDDDLRGSHNDNMLNGSFGDDFIMGRGGADILIGGEGDDILSGGDGDDVLSGGDGNDRLIGGAGDDRLTGGAGADVLIGNAGNNTLVSGAGNDTIYDGAGDGVLYGGTGADRLIGSGGNDRIYGAWGNDRLSGGNGNDRLSGDQGNDYLVGGGGGDIFIFRVGGDADRIEDYDITLDRLFIEAALTSGETYAVNVVSDYASLSGADTVFDFGGGDVLTLLGFDDLTALSDTLVFI